MTYNLLIYDQIHKFTIFVLGLRLSISSSQGFYKKMIISEIEFGEDLID